MPHSENKDYQLIPLEPKAYLTLNIIEGSGNFIIKNGKLVREDNPETDVLTKIKLFSIPHALIHILVKLRIIK